MAKKITKPSTQHLSLEELIEFFFVSPDKVDKKLLPKAPRVNKHVIECEDCYKMWLSMHQIAETGEIYANIMGAVENLKSPGLSQEKKREEAEYIRSKVGYYDDIVIGHNK